MNSSSCLKWRCRNWRCTSCPAAAAATNWCDKEQATPYNMISPALAPSAPDDELAKAKRLLAKHPELVALLGEAVAEEDRPASHYGRVNALVAALLVLDAGLLAAAAASRNEKGIAAQVEYLYFPLACTAAWALVFGTLDSAAMGRRSVGMWVGIMLLQALLFGGLNLLYGKLAWGIAYLLTMAFFAGVWGWLLSVMRTVLRERFRGQRAHRAHCYASRGLEIAGFQIMLMVAGVSQGVGGAEAYARCHASATFGTSLIVAWAFSIGVFDVSCVDPRAAVALRLRPLELSCLICAGGVVLSGLAGFVIAEQNKPNLQAAEAAGGAFMVSAVLGVLCLSRLVFVARRRDRARGETAPVEEQKDAP